VSELPLVVTTFFKPDTVTPEAVRVFESRSARFDSNIRALASDMFFGLAIAMVKFRSTESVNLVFSCDTLVIDALGIFRLFGK
jgi:hypothetical protein